MTTKELDILLLDLENYDSTLEARLGKIRHDRLLKVVQHLRRGKLAHKRFDFTSLNTKLYEGDEVNAKYPDCGSCGCAIGEFPVVFPRSFKFTSGNILMDNATVDFSSLADFFMVSRGVIGHLFYPEDQEPTMYGGVELGEDATAKQVARNIEKFIALMIKLKERKRYARK